METREKLIEFTNNVLRCLPWGEISSHTAEDVADHLIANGVKIPVLCKECSFCKYNSSNDTYKCCSMNGMFKVVNVDDFCSYGERREQ